MRIGSSRYHIDGILGSKLGYTNTARYSYACLAEQNGVRLICVTMQSELSTDKYSDVRTLLDDAFATFTGYTELSGGSVTAQLPVAGGGSTLGTVTVADPGGVRGVHHPGRYKAGEHQREGSGKDLRHGRPAGSEHRGTAGFLRGRGPRPQCLDAGRHLPGLHGRRGRGHRAGDAAGEPHPAQKTPQLPPGAAARQLSAKACPTADFSR